MTVSLRRIDITSFQGHEACPLETQATRSGLLSKTGSAPSRRSSNLVEGSGPGTNYGGFLVKGSFRPVGRPTSRTCRHPDWPLNKSPLEVYEVLYAVREVAWTSLPLLCCMLWGSPSVRCQVIVVGARGYDS